VLEEKEILAAVKCYGIERLSAQKKVKAKRQQSQSCEEKAIESHSKTFL